MNSFSSSKDHAVYFTDDEKIYNALNSKVNLDQVGAYKGRHGVTLDPLSQKLLISPEAARRTVQYTIQRGIRTILHPSLSRRFKTNDQALS